MDSDNSIFKMSRRKTLDVSRLSSVSFPTPSKEKRYSMDSNQPPLRSNRAEKLAFIEESLQLLKAEMNPLHHKDRQGIRSLTASHSAKDTEFASKTAKWHHKNDIAELRPRPSIESSMPPRYQRKYKGVLAGPRPHQDEKKSKQLGWATIFFILLTVLGILAANYWLVKNYQKELCERNLTFNLTSFNSSLRNHVYGQHLVVDIVPFLVQEQIVLGETSPLVMAFLGWTGVGKNLVGSILGDHIRTKKRTLHKYIVPLHFPDSDSQSYKQSLQNWVIGNLSSCAVNLVIIDEIEKASDDVLLGVELLLEKMVKFRMNSTKVIVLLLSSSGGTQINKFLYHHISNALERESVTSLDILEVLKATEAQWFLSLHARGLIKSIVPFLPLEKRHVARCIEKDIETKHDTCANPHIVAEVLKELTFFPQENPVFSSAGCRKVGTKVDLVIDSIESRHSYYGQVNGKL